MLLFIEPAATRAGKVGLGLVLFIVLTVLAWGKPMLGPGIIITANFAYASRLIPGCPVYLDGVKVGMVKNVTLHSRRPAEATSMHPAVSVEMFIDAKAQPMLTEDAQFKILPQDTSLMTFYVDVIPGPASSAVLADGAVVRGVETVRVDTLSTRAVEILDRVAALLERDEMALSDVLHGRSSMRVLLGNQMDEDEMREVVDGLRAIAGMGTALAENPEKAEKLIGQVHNTLSRLDRILGKVERGEGTVGKMMHDEKLYQDLRDVVHDANRSPWKLLSPKRERQKAEEKKDDRK